MFVEVIYNGVSRMAKCRAGPANVRKVSVGRSAVLALIGVMVVESSSVGPVPSGTLLDHFQDTEVVFGHEFVGCAGELFVDSV